MTSTKDLLEDYQLARSLFTNGSFAEADRKIRQYKALVDYRSMPFEDRRTHAKCHLSVIIVSYDQNQELVNCLNSIEFSKDYLTEIIVIDNGKNESVHSELSTRQLFHFLSPINFAPSEGRNIGAHFASGDILVFIDDDCLVEPAFLECVQLAFNTIDFLAIRGRILPKSSGGNASAPRHYDLGRYPIPAPLVTEGNMAVPKEVYKSVGGMHPLMFGLEGVEFTWRLQQHFPEKDIYYWPNMMIRHDHVAWDGRVVKKKRHAVARAYLKYRMGKHADLTAQFNRWYDDRPGPYKRYESRSALVRLRQVALDGIVAALYGRKG